MEVSSSAAVGALRVGIQVISNHRRPVLEFYYELHNDFGPEVTSHSRVAGESTHRFHRVFVSLFLINIGGVRAENVMLAISSGYKRERGFGSRFGTEFAQLAPGQVVHLFQLDQHDLFPNDNAKQNECKFQMDAEYNAPWQGINRALRIRSHLRGEKQFCTAFLFNSDIVAGDLPSPKYA